MIKDILFPVDFSPACTAMSGFVKRAAAMFGAQVTLLHVCDLTSHNGFELYCRPPSEIAEDHRRIAQDKLNKFLRADFPEEECSRLLLTGPAARSIIECAWNGRFDLIVMPTHAGNFRRMFLGSTTASVLNEASCPVLTTQHAETISPRPLEHRVWACALSLGPDSERVLRRASEEAGTIGAKLLLIHVQDFNTREPAAGLPHEKEPASHHAEQARQRLEEMCKTVGAAPDLVLGSGEIRESLLETVNIASADVLIIGRKLQTSAPSRMSGLAYELIRDSPCPVLSV